MRYAKLNLYGEVSEWLKEHAWKACVGSNAYLGFESPSLRQKYFALPLGRAKYFYQK